MQIGLFSRSGFCHALFAIPTLLILGFIPKGGVAQTSSAVVIPQSEGPMHVLPLALSQSASPMAQEASTPAPRAEKNPKLTTTLADLARAVPQQQGQVPKGQRIAPPPGFSLATLPRSVRDAVRAKRMRITKDAEVQVFIEISEVTDENLNALRALGVAAQIVGKPKPDKTMHEVLTYVPTVQALLPATMIDQVSALPFVRYIRLPDYGFTNTGSVDTQGDSILMAEQARSQFGVDGTGVKVGVISDGIGGIFATGCTTCGPTTATPSPITLGDLPNATGTRDPNAILTSASGGIVAQSFPSSSRNLEPPASHTASGVGAEGTAMLEIVHDLAPGAQLYFANAADGTSMSFELAVDFLASKVDVVVDDISFFIGPKDGTSDVSANTAAALNTDANPIRAYFTAVGNQALDHYQENFLDSGVSNWGRASITGFPGDVQLFQATPNTSDTLGLGPCPGDSAPLQEATGLAICLGDLVLLRGGGTITVYLTWDDPWGASKNDYDLFLVQAVNASFRTPPVAESINPQTGTQDPFEVLAYTNPGLDSFYEIVIQNYNNQAAIRNLDMFINCSGCRPWHGAPPSFVHNFNTLSGSVPAQADAGGSPVSVISVGATDAQTDSQGNLPASIIEPYSSQGPTEATPQAAARMKPDVTATDGVSVTGAGGFGYGDSLHTTPCPLGNTPCFFFGTSAAAPHAAGVAALLLQSAPCLLSSSAVNAPATARANLRNLITSTAVPLSAISDPVPNNIEGFGLIDALTAVTKTLPTADAGPNQTVNGTSASGATVTLSGSSADPDNCALTLNWSGACGTAVGANPALTCPLGLNLETLTASNGGATRSLSASTVQITVTTFAISSSPSSASVSPGQSATYALSVAQQYGAFTSAVSLACSNLPSRSTCSLSPNSVTPGSSGATSKLTISTTAPSAIFKVPSDHRPVHGLWIGLIALCLVGLAALKRSAKARIALPYFTAVLFVLILTLQIACGGGGGGGSGITNPGTPPGTYTITITGTAGSLTNSVSVTLTVQ